MENATLYVWDLFDANNVVKIFVSVYLLNIIFIYIVKNLAVTLKMFLNIPFFILPIELNIVKLDIW